MTLEQEKEYAARRAEVAIREMERAIRACDRERFERAWPTAMRYMKKKDRVPYYKRMLDAELHPERYEWNIKTRAMFRECEA